MTRFVLDEVGAGAKPFEVPPVAKSDPLDIKLVKSLLAVIDASCLARLVDNIRAIGVLHTGSACSGSNIVAWLLMSLFKVVKCGTLADEYVCESVVFLVLVEQ
jgi:hypothetical protein